MKTMFETWQEYFLFKGLDPNALPDVSMIPEEYRAPRVAGYILEVIVEVENGDNKPDYNDLSQGKYEPRARVIADADHPSGSGLVYSVAYVCWNACTFCGVRLVFTDWRKVQPVFEKFKPLYEDLWLKK